MLSSQKLWKNLERDRNEECEEKRKFHKIYKFSNSENNLSRIEN